MGLCSSESKVLHPYNFSALSQNYSHSFLVTALQTCLLVSGYAAKVSGKGMLLIQQLSLSLHPQGYNTASFELSAPGFFQAVELEPSENANNFTITNHARGSLRNVWLMTNRSWSSLCTCRSRCLQVSVTLLLIKTSAQMPRSYGMGIVRGLQKHLSCLHRTFFSSWWLAWTARALYCQSPPLCP